MSIGPWIIIGSLAALVFGGTPVLKNSLYYHPKKEHDYPKPNVVKDVYIPLMGDGIFNSSQIGHLHGWLYLPNDHKDKPLVFFCHGNAGNISHRMHLIEKFINHKVPFFMFDYRGFGKSDGVTFIESTYKDANKCYKYLRRELGLKCEIVAVGESIGSFPASKLAVEKGLDKLILIGGINSIQNVVEESSLKYVGSLTKGDLDVGKQLSMFGGKTLLIHSKTDEVVSFNNAVKNKQMCRGPVTLHPAKGTHNDMLYKFDVITEFLV